MSKIRRKTKKQKQTKISDDVESETDNEVCLICNEPFTLIQPKIMFCKIHHYNPEFLIKDLARSTQKYHMFTTCTHKFHLTCSSQKHSHNCPYCRFEGDFIVQDLYSNYGLIIENLENVLDNVDGPKDKHNFLTSPFIQCVRTLKLVSENRLQQNILPVLRIIAKIFYSGCQEFWDEKMTKISEIRNAIVREELHVITSKINDSFSQFLEAIFPEYLFGKSIILMHFDQVRQTFDMKDPFEKNQTINALFESLIRENLWKFVVLKLLQKNSIESKLIDKEMIVSDCRDLCEVVYFLEQSLLMDATYTANVVQKKFNAEYIERKLLFAIN